LTGCDGIRHDPGESTIAWRIAVETRTHRRAILSSGVRIAYAAPLVAASMAIDRRAGGAYYGDCSCYDPIDHFSFSSLGGSCDADWPEPCGACVTCSPRYGSQCPEDARVIGSMAPGCDIGFPDQYPNCHVIFRPICEALISDPD
jgi:hypothetical protein